MRSLYSRFKNVGLSAFVLTGLIACGIGGDSGRLSLSLTDAATDQYHAVYVTIREVAVHAKSDIEDSWTVISTPNKTYDLLALTNGVREQLALVDLSAGHYTQLRLMIGDAAEAGVGVVNILGVAHPHPNYVIDTENEYHSLKIPSGFQTGIKIVQGFDINDNGTTELILDFNASESVVVAGKSGKYLLKPTIKVLSESFASIINGTVTNAADQTAVPGAIVSAQVYDGTAADPKDQIVVRASTVSGETGAYKIFITPGSYNVVATKAGFAPLPAAVTSEAGLVSTQDFALAAVTDTGTVAGTVTIAGAGDEAFATLSFRQTITVGTTDFNIEVRSVNVASGGDYSVGLPVGTYKVISSSLGRVTQVLDVTVTKDTTTTHDVAF